MKRSLSINQKSHEVKVHEFKANKVSFEWGGKQHSFEVIQRSGDTLILRNAEGVQFRMSTHALSQGTLVSGAGLDAEISEGSSAAKKKAGALGSLSAPMPGKVFKVMTKVGDAVKQGQTLLILEAMKMEHPIKADKDGKVKKILFNEGDLVQGGMALAELE